MQKTCAEIIRREAERVFGKRRMVLKGGRATWDSVKGKERLFSERIAGLLFGHTMFL